MRHSVTLAVLIGLAAVCLPLMFSLAVPCAVFSAMPEEAPAEPALPSWGEEIPEAVRAAALVPDLVLDEEPCDWRPAVAGIFVPAVKDCKRAREAVLAIAENIGELTGVYYSMERSKPCMNALEALKEKKVSCTGQSVLLTCALRSVGIPARAVGVWTWNHVRGNHTWVEAYFEGGWHMVEFNEKDFNTPWVMEAIGMLEPGSTKLPQLVLARSVGTAAENELPFPTPWNMEAKLAAEDVTERYTALARDWYAQNGVPADRQKLMVDVQPRSDKPRALLLEDEAGKELARTPLPTTKDDVRQFATLLLPRGGENAAFFLRIEGTEAKIPVKPTETPVQTLHLVAKL